MPVTRKTPFRPRTDEKITQAYNDGIVTIYTVEDVNAGTGYAPHAVTTELIKLAYQERKLGIRRYYEAKQNQINVERVIRVPKPPMDITNQDVAETDDGNAYRIDLVQIVPDVCPPSLDLTLEAYTQLATPEDDDDDDDGGDGGDDKDDEDDKDDGDDGKTEGQDEPPEDNGEEDGK